MSRADSGSGARRSTAANRRTPRSSHGHRGGRAVESNDRGLRTAGRVLTYGVIPPAAGVARVAWCLNEGLAQLAAGTTQLGTAHLNLIEVFVSYATTIPPYYPLHLTTTEEHASDIADQRRSTWRAAKAAAAQPVGRPTRNGGPLLAASATSGVSRPRDTTLAWGQADKGARSAEATLVVAYNCLREAATEAGAITDDALRRLPITDTTYSAADLRTLIGNSADRAHELVHQAAELVSGLFGCTITYEDGAWMDTCQLTMMHRRLGLSAGFTARHTCSICAKDLAACVHVLGRRYELTATQVQPGHQDLAPGKAQKSTCSVCGETGCDHVVGRRYFVTASPVLRDAVMHEVSLTPRPRDPRSQIEKFEVAVSHLIESVGRVPHRKDVLHRMSCAAPCTGFDSPLTPDSDLSGLSSH